MNSSLLSLTYPKLKLAIVLLLTLNVFIYAVVDTFTSAVDAFVWLVLLILYELETNELTTNAQPLLNRIRDIIILIIPIVFLSYLHSKEWLDVVNSIFWFALIALLEIEIRWPDKVLQYQNIYWLATGAVFLGLFAMVAAWLWQSAWLDAYDAALWLVAFGVIEVDIFQLFQRKHSNV